MDTLDVTTLSRPFVWEPFPPTRFDSVPAVLYRVGTDSDPANVLRRFSNAEREALTARFIPRLESTRTRYISAICIEEPRDLVRPCHERPALVRALAMARLLSGGLLLESLDDLGCSTDLFAAVIVALNLPGMWSVQGHKVRTHEVTTPATLTVGYIGASKGRRAATRTEFERLADHVRGLPSIAARRTGGEGLVVSDVEDALRTLVARCASEGEAILDKDHIAWNKLATSSDVLDDLSYSSGCDYITASRSDGASADRIVELLRLYGFINLAGHRTWSRSQVRQVGGAR